MMTLDEFIAAEQIEMQPTRIPSRPDGNDWGKGSRHWDCRLFFVGRGLGTPEMRVYFSQGSAHISPPTAAEVLDCLASDASSVTEDFEDWCAEMGYDSDSRKAEKIYNVCREQTRNLRKFLACGRVGKRDAFDTLVNDIERQ